MYVDAFLFEDSNSKGDNGTLRGEISCPVSRSSESARVGSVEWERGLKRSEAKGGGGV